MDKNWPAIRIAAVRIFTALALVAASTPLYANPDNLEKSGFLKELWGGDIPGKKW